MSEQLLFDTLVVAWLVLAAVVATTLFFVIVPYGRHARKGWGPQMNTRLGWVVMEAPAVVVFAAFFLMGDYLHSISAWLLFAMWQVHYVYRAFIYPLRLRGAGKRMPVVVVVMGVLFNVVNGYMNGRYLCTLSGGYTNQWLRDPRFVVGSAIFATGLLFNRQADATLRRLRRPERGGYAIPYGGLYRWVSCPNYLGEMVQWTGWAIATWSPAGLAFAVWTAANLAPRARAHHRWFHEHFADYPPERKALVPGVW